MFRTQILRKRTDYELEGHKDGWKIICYCPLRFFVLGVTFRGWIDQWFRWHSISFYVGFHRMWSDGWMDWWKERWM
jgi:hypothetical protein